MTSRLRWSGAAVVALLVAVMVVAAAPRGVLTPDASATNIPTPWTVTVTPNTALRDGTRVLVNISTDADHPITTASVQLCRTGVNYRPSFGTFYNDDFRTGGVNCPNAPVSSSGDYSYTSTAVGVWATQANGFDIPFFVGSGTITWQDFSSNPQTLTCDSDHPCALVVEVRGTDNAGDVRWIPFVQELTYGIDDPLAGCGGKADAALVAAGGDRFVDSWIGWTLDQCHRPGAQTGAATLQSFPGEGSAMDSFSRGDVDIAYSGFGYDEAAGLGRGTRGEPLTPRDSVAVPVAINAAVFAAGNGREGPGGTKVPYSPVKITHDELASLIASGLLQGYDQTAILNRNPELQATTMLVSPQTSSIRLGAVSEVDSSTRIMTTLFDTMSGSLWKVPDSAAFGPERNMERGVSNAFGTAQPSFAGALDLYSGRSLLFKALRQIPTDTVGPIWDITDLASATSLYMTPSQISNSRGDFVGPTPESMLAAIPYMTVQPDGRRVPNVSAVAQNPPSELGAESVVQPYGLTYIEYAIVPAQPLVDPTTCAPRTASQKLLTDWLTYVTTVGQDHLAPGLVALPDSLRTEAAAAIAKVGATASTCGKAAVGVTAPSGDSPVAPPASISTSVRRATTVAPATGSTATAAAAAASSAVDDSELVSAIAAMPTFGGSGGSGAMIGMIVVFGLLLLAALATSGRLGLRRRS